MRKASCEEKSEEPDYLQELQEVSVYLAKNNDTSLDREFTIQKKLNSPKKYR